MNVSEKKIEQRMARFEKACKESGAKLTHQRIEIFREVAKTGDHPDAEKVLQGVRERMPTISPDTVYRTLWWLKDLGLINILWPIRKSARFDANLSRHHHFVCTRCGLTRDFISDQLDGLDLSGSIEPIGYAKNIQVEVTGLCLKCANEEKTRAEKQKKEEAS